MEKLKGKIIVAPDGTPIGSSGAAATYRGPDSTPIEVVDKNGKRIEMTTLGQLRKKLGLK